MSTFVMKLRIRYLVEEKNLVYVACHVVGQVFHIVLYSDQNSGRNLSIRPTVGPCVSSRDCPVRLVRMLSASSLRERAGESQCERGCEHE